MGGNVNSLSILILCRSTDCTGRVETEYLQPCANKLEGHQNLEGLTSIGRAHESCSEVLPPPPSQPAAAGLEVVRNSNLRIQRRCMRLVENEAVASWGTLSMK